MSLTRRLVPAATRLCITRKRFSLHRKLTTRIFSSPLLQPAADSSSPALPVLASLSSTAAASHDATASLQPQPSNARAIDPFAPDATFFASTVDCFRRRAPRDCSSLLDLPLEASSRTGEIFANNDTNLKAVTFYGFDLDFTLAHYKESVGELIYELAKMYLMRSLAYPKELLEHLTYDVSFPIRGLFFDSVNGFIFKLDEFSRIQLETVHHGRRLVPPEEVLRVYSDASISKEYEQEHLVFISDQFALPFVALLADLVQVMNERKIEFMPLYLYRDVERAIDHAHTSSSMHEAIIANPGAYLQKEPRLRKLLQSLRDSGKTCFLLTNSNWKFANAVMSHMLEGSNLVASPGNSIVGDWLELFDVAIFSARKPLFWSRSGQFRRIDPATGSLSFSPVRELKCGEIYTEGSLGELQRLTGMRNASVLYAGDSYSADLIHPSESATWRTLAVISELEKETRVMNEPSFRAKLRELLTLQQLIDYGQRLDDESSRERVSELKKLRKSIRHDLLVKVHPHFGSVFRTHSHRSRFSFEISRYSDIYTSNVLNLLNYAHSHCFYASRSELPHEPRRSVIMSTPLLPTRDLTLPAT